MVIITPVGHMEAAEVDGDTMVEVEAMEVQEDKVAMNTAIATMIAIATTTAMTMVMVGIMVAGNLDTDMKAWASLANNQQNGSRENIYRIHRVGQGLEFKSSATALNHLQKQTAVVGITSHQINNHHGMHKNQIAVHPHAMIAGQRINLPVQSRRELGPPTHVISLAPSRAPLERVAHGGSETYPTAMDMPETKLMAATIIIPNKAQATPTSRNPQSNHHIHRNSHVPQTHRALLVANKAAATRAGRGGSGTSPTRPERTINRVLLMKQIDYDKKLGRPRSKDGKMPKQVGSKDRERKACLGRRNLVRVGEGGSERLEIKRRVWLAVGR